LIASASETARHRPSAEPRSQTTAPPGARPLAAEGLFQALGQGLGEAYLGAFALLLGAGGLSLGLVATLPTASTALAQVLARRARAGMGTARTLVARAWSAQAIGYAALGLCALAAYPRSIVYLCAVAFLAWGLGGIAVPAWTTLVSAVVPRGRLGWFFGQRGALQQIGVVTAILGGGSFLSLMTAKGEEPLGFALLFLVAGLARAAGTALLAGVPDQAAARRERPRLAGAGFLRTSGKVRRLAFYLWSVHLATCISTPFFVPYMIKDLRFPYALVGLIVAVPAIVKVATLRLWGRLADRVGPGPVLRATGWLVVIVPALWLFSGNPWWILAAQVYSGVVWGAFELAQASSILQATRGREHVVALFNAVDGGLLIAGSLLGGIVVNLVDRHGRSGYLAAIAVSTVLRGVPAVVLLWRVRGIGRPTWSHLKLPLRVWAVRPTRGFSLRPVGDMPPEAPRVSAPAGSASRDA
jgi:MFS family permease